MFKQILQRNALLSGTLLAFACLSSASAFPLQPGMQIVADPQLQACLDQAVAANNWSDSEDVTALSCPQLSIQTVTGISQLVNLSQLDLSGNRLREVYEIDLLAQLTGLNLSENALIDIAPLTALQNLQSLNLGGNGRLDGQTVANVIQNNPGLTHLGVAGIDFGGNPGWLPPYGPMGEYDLVELDVSRTGQYPDLYPFTQYPNLKVLKAAGNRIQFAGPIDPSLQLEELDLSDNDLGDLQGLQNQLALRRLNIGGNSRLASAEVQTLIQNNPGLTHLAVAGIDFEGNIGWLPPAGPQGEFDLVELDVSRTGQYPDLYPFTQYPNLKVLKAAGNRIQFTGPIDPSLQFEEIDLSDNLLSDLYGLQNQQSIRRLDLSGNTRLAGSEVELLIQNNTNLTHLAVADIRFETLTHSWLPPYGTQGEYDLVELDVSRTGQYLDLYPFSQYPHLRVLKAAGNRMQFTGPLDPLQQLEEIDLSDNDLNDLYGLQNLINLRRLALSGNTRLAAPEVQMLIQNNPGLTHLAVAGIAFGNDLNWLPQPGPQGEYDMVELDISHTGQYPDLYPLYRYPNLKVLKAAGNHIQFSGPLDPLQQLEELDLSDNDLGDLYGLQNLYTIRQLNLNGNTRLAAADVQMLIQNNSGLTRLAVADIAFGNDLNWLPPAGPQGEYDLVELDISRTGQYFDLYPLSQYSNLEVLRAAGNGLQYTGPLHQLLQLQELDLGENDLGDLYGLEWIKRLRLLDLSGNSRLAAPDVQMLIQNNPNLTHLAVADIAMGNDLNWLPASGPQGEFDLAELDISRTGQYADLYPLSQYLNLKVLRAAGNGLQFTGPLGQLQQLEELDLGDNALLNLYDLQMLNSLSKLVLSGNTQLPPAEVQSVLNNNPGLTHLAVAGIPMGDTLNWLPPQGYFGEFDLVELDISGTGQLVDLMMIEQYENLRVLRASGLQLQYTWPVEQLQYLEVLELRDNDLSMVMPLTSLASLSLLDLRDNGAIPCDELDNLEAGLPMTQILRPVSCVYLTPPTVTLMTPIEGEIFFTTGKVRLSADANDVEDGNIGHAVVWTSDLDGVLGSGPQLDVSLSAGQHVISATVVDSHGNEASQSVSVTVLPNTAPQLSLLQPLDGGLFNAGTPLLLTAEAIDAEQSDLSANIQWTSSLDGPMGSGASLPVNLSAGQHVLTARVTDAAGAVAEQTVTITINAAPALTLLSPANGALFQQGDSVMLSAQASDSEDGDLSGQIVWTSSLDGALGSGANVNAVLSGGTHVLTASVSDSNGATVVRTVTVTVNQAPQLTLLGPNDGDVFMLQENVVLSANASDPESGDIGGAISWSSDIDGALGSGATLQTTLSLGTHTVTASISDGNGGVANASIQIVVRQIDLNVAVSGKGRRKTADLVWSGSRTAVDIYMDDVLVGTGPASGSQQLTFKDTAVFKVCETGTGYCSPDFIAQ